MKLLILSALTLITLQFTAQQTHIITGYDHYFSPDTSYINVGDTVRLVSVGYHSITELDSTDWANDVATDNGGFWIGLNAPTFEDWFVVNQAGKYYFNCNPHAGMGMKGVLYVGSSMNVQEASSNKEFSVQIREDKVIYLNYVDVDNVNIYNISGKLMQTQQLSNPARTVLPNLNLTQGLYIVSFTKGNKVITTCKIVLD